MYGTSDPNNTIDFKNMDTLIWSQNIIKVDTPRDGESDMTWPYIDVLVSECALYYYVNNYTT